MPKDPEPFDPDKDFTTDDTFDPDHPPKMPVEHISAAELDAESAKARKIIEKHLGRKA